MGFSKQEYWSGCGYFKTLCIFPVTRSYSKIEDFPCGLAVKNLSVMQETRIDKGPRFHPWVRKIHWRRKWQPTPVFLPGKSHGCRSLVAYSPRGCKELDTTERLHFTSLVCMGACMCVLSCVRLFVTPWTAAHQASLSITNSWSLLKLISIELVMSSNHLILCGPLLLLLPIFPSIRVFSNELVVCIGCTIGSRKYCRTGEYSQYFVITVNGK